MDSIKKLYTILIRRFFSHLKSESLRLFPAKDRNSLIRQLDNTLIGITTTDHKREKTWIPQNKDSHTLKMSIFF